ncbi:glycoside hydrolase [Basidiobolus meristosporus CBS 931.73]|uniref:Trehalase n=1 Tax=Basidiobolus meristosporus CBS 931.73 TaxID=1314790 RepID=A0A1Y1YDM5_9FUNG|nr:glycoside hydrolase [Basidiobolus meristosporus CBS 931.73]|eukprot:ORX96141.1 glycoside hydrolase [Basidiobolus meristosporus CBS 931.73]
MPVLQHFLSVKWLTAALLFSSEILSTNAVGCDSPIYCPGPLLDRIQKAKLYPDSKTFVDQPTSKPLDQVLAAFNTLSATANNDTIAQFVKENFLEAGKELVPADLPEYKDQPEFLNNIKDEILRGWAQVVHSYWKKLTRRMDESFLCAGCVTSLLDIKRPFVIPGGRFREIYYWDTYFVIEGLLLSELPGTAKNMIENFLDLVDKYGFMPNGARIYYLNRSQPPMLTQMVKIYYEKTKDMDLLRRALPTLDKEYDFWVKNHTIEIDHGKKYKLSHYNTINDQPRPESYMEDYVTVEGSTLDEEGKKGLYADLATGAESGWDYSVRWLKVYPTKNESGPAILRTLNTRQVVPTDLNAILYMNEKTLAEFHQTVQANQTGDKIQYYNKVANTRKSNILKLLWDEQDLHYYDFNATSGSVQKLFTPSNYWPFWAEIFPNGFITRPNKVMKTFSIVEQFANKFVAGIPTTEINSTLQWDFPNAWPPLQYVLMKSVISVNNHIKDTNTKQRLDKLGLTLAQRMVDAAYCGWRMTGGSIPGLLEPIPGNNDTGHMFEKFDVTRLGVAGGGGEYEVQDGFGWTNGVTLWTLNLWGDKLKYPTDCNRKVHNLKFR